MFAKALGSGGWTAMFRPLPVRLMLGRVLRAKRLTIQWLGPHMPPVLLATMGASSRRLSPLRARATIGR